MPKSKEQDARDISAGLEYARNPIKAFADGKKISDELDELAKRDPSMLEELTARRVEIACLGVCVAEIIKGALHGDISPDEGVIGMTNVYSTFVLMAYRDGLNAGRSESLLKLIEGEELTGRGNN